ncbi:MAG: Bug family tripartite tricarboxylate transporter substrate binding protein [Burkholderiales bacterium]
MDTSWIANPRYVIEHKTETLIMRKLLSRLAVLLIGVWSAVALSQTYPPKPVTLVVPYPPGGGADVMARIIAANLTAQLSGTVIVENKPGANGNIGTASVAKASPDGYTLLLATTGHALNKFLYKSPGYDPTGDFSPVALIGSTDLVLVVRSDSPLRSAKEIVDFAKANPSKLNFASAGSGSVPHLTIAMFESAANVKVTHVPYKGAAPAIADLVGGQVDAYFASLPSAIGMITTNKVIALATTGAKRSTLLDNIPTMQESGFPSVISDIWFGIAAPAKTPAAITERLASAIRSSLVLPETVKQLRGLGVEVRYQGASEFASLLASDLSKWKVLVQSTGAKLD